MNFGSDNTGPVHPKVMEALIAANSGSTPAYGEDALTEKARDMVREVLDAPDAMVQLVPTGTAANALILACFSKPWQTVLCHRVAHIETDECGAPEFFTGGGKLTLLEGADAKIDPAGLGAALGEIPAGDVHVVQAGALSLTQVTERGSVYDLAQIKTLTGIAKAHGLPTHMDGARFANAVTSLGVTPAAMTHQSGVDALSFGGTKNGLMAVEAAVIFDPALNEEFEIRRKRAAHLFSKHRYLAAQMVAYLTDDLWLEMAASANAAGAQLIAGLEDMDHATVHHTPRANMVFATLPRAAHRRAVGAGIFYGPTEASLAGGEDTDPITVRFVCDWSKTEAQVTALLDHLAG